MPKVSIGMAFYKDVETIGLAIKSILMQTYTDWELLLLDDGGCDGSAEVVRNFRDNRIKLLSDGKNKGLAARLNELINLADGEYFARMDADDIMHPDRLTHQVDFLDNHTDIDVVGSGAYSIDESNNILGERITKNIPDDYFSVCKGSIFIHPTVIGRTRWFKRYYYNATKQANRAEDYDLWCRSYPDSKFWVLSEPLLFYRETASISKNIDNYINSYKNMRKLVCNNKKRGITYAQYIYLMLMFSAKQYIYYFAWLLGGTGVILRRRFLQLNDTRKKQAEDILQKIMLFKDTQ